MIYVGSFFLTFFYAFIKGFQHKNVIGNHVKSAAVLAFLMGVMDVLSIGLIIKGGFPIAISAGLGASIGIVGAIKLHSKFYSER